MDLTTSARVKLAALGLSATSTADSRVSQFITDCSAAVEAFLDRGLEYVARTEYFHVEPGQRVFKLRGYPAITSLVVYNDPAHQTSTYTQFPAGTIVDASVAAIDAERGLLIFDGYGPMSGPNVLKVTYTGGAATTATSATLFAGLFPDIAQAVDLAVVECLNQASLVGAVNVSQFGTSISMGAEDWPPWIRGRLVKHKRPAVG